MAGHGGYRPGAGRKADVNKYGGHIEAAKDRIVQALPRLIDNMLSLADGVHQEKTLPDGKTVVVYERPPDRQAIEYLVNRIMGRPTERTEVNGQGGIPIEVTSEAMAMAAAGLEAWRAEMRSKIAPEGCVPPGGAPTGA